MCLPYGVERTFILELIGYDQRFPFAYWRAVQILWICQSAELQSGDGDTFPRTGKCRQARGLGIPGSCCLLGLWLGGIRRAKG